MSRPRLELDESLIEKLAGIHCTMVEIAHICGCSVDTLERRYAEIIKKGQSKGKSSLRRHQWELAQKGNPTMLIWLGKQHLEQKDQPQPQANTEHVRPIQVTTEQLTMLVSAARRK